MRKRKEITVYIGSWDDSPKSNKVRISSSNFLLSYSLSKHSYRSIPKELIPDIAPNDDMFWENWYLSNLNLPKMPSNREVKVHVYWLKGHLRCEWSIKPRVRLYLNQFNLRFEKPDIENNLDYIYIANPTIISNTTTSVSPTLSGPTRPKSNKTLNKFRGKYLIFTYSQLPKKFVDSLFISDSGNKKSADEIKDFLRSSHGWDKLFDFDLKSFVVSREVHKDGSPHIHIHCNITNLPRSVNVHSFDIWTGSDWSHPHVQSSKSLPIKGITYVIKDGDFIADPSLLIVNTPSSGYRLFTTELYVRRLARTVGLDEAERFYENNDPEGYLLNWPKVSPELENSRQAHLSKLIDSKQSLFFKDGPEFPFIKGSNNYIDLINWVESVNNISDWWGHSLDDELPRSLIVLGPPNIGKGEFIRAHLRKFIAEGSVVWAQTKEDLSRVKAHKTKIVVFDDIEWRLKGVFAESESSASLLLSTINDRTIERRYKSGGYFLPERTVVIVISNPNKLPNFMGGNLKSEVSRQLTPKEIDYIDKNPGRYYNRLSQLQDNSSNTNSNKKSRAVGVPYSFEDLPPEKHTEAGYNNIQDLYSVPLDIYPKRCLILHLGSEDILFDPTKSKAPVRRSFNTDTKLNLDRRYTNDLIRHWEDIQDPLVKYDSYTTWESFYRDYSPSSPQGKTIINFWTSEQGKSILEQHDLPSIESIYYPKAPTKRPRKSEVWDPILPYTKT